MAGPLLENPISCESKRCISYSFWGSSQADGDLGPFFHYYTLQCSQIMQASGPGFPLKIHQDIVDIAADIRGRIPYPEIRQSLLERYSHESQSPLPGQLDDAIALVARLMLMIDVGEFSNAYTGRRNIVWNTGTIDHFLGSLPAFTRRQPGSSDSGRLPAIFNARNLYRIAGFKVVLTTNLADHLVVKEGETKSVLIFHHASFLRLQTINSIFEDDFVRETLQTLALLFPQDDSAVGSWYRRLGDSDELDVQILKCGDVVRRLDKYDYWQERLSKLKDMFDEARPTTLSQWWNDRRDGVQWTTLWLAIGCTVFFGLVQSIEGALQVYKAYHPAG